VQYAASCIMRRRQKKSEEVPASSSIIIVIARDQTANRHDMVLLATMSQLQESPKCARVAALSMTRRTLQTQTPRQPARPRRLYR
jgi:hypothetical protein